MSTEENKELVRHAYELGNQRNWAAFYELGSSDFVFHYASMTIPGLEAYKQFLSMYLSAFPDLHSTIEDMIAEDDTVVVRYTWRGTHQGELMGIPPNRQTGRSDGDCHLPNRKRESRRILVKR